MPRKARKDSKSCFYHVIVQGINKEFIFDREEYIKKYKQLIMQKLKQSNLIILAYCIMNNHAHFLMYTEKSEYLGKYMQRLNTSYGYFYNKEKDRVGFVFRNRYYSQEILSQRQLLNCLAYIHNNPVKANMVKRPEEYKFSSYNEFLSKKEIITDKGIKLIYGSSKNYENQFKMIHRNNKECFMDIKEVDICDFMSEVELKYNINIKDVHHNKALMKSIIIDAREKTDATLVQLAEIFDVSKSTVGKYANQKNKKQ